jgi:hypothetical protein
MLDAMPKSLGVRLAILLALVALTVPAAAQADADPASDVLYPYSVFFPFDVSFGKGEQSQLLQTVEAAQKDGYLIKVAIITKPSDLGAIPMLFMKPQEYASFLGRELAPALYTGRLLVVMPNGFGVWHYRHTVDREQAVLRRLTVGTDPTPTAMVVAATEAVRRLAAADGHQLPAVAGSKGSSSTGVIVIAASVGGALTLLAGGAWVWLRRRHSTR